jgi:hypothetical protein
MVLVLERTGLAPTGSERVLDLKDASATGLSPH